MAVAKGLFRGSILLGAALAGAIGIHTYHARPRYVLMRYLDATKSGEWNLVKQYISHEDQSNKIKEEWESNYGKGRFAHFVLEKCTYSVVEINKNNNYAYIKTSCTGPDPSALAKEAHFVSSIDKQKINTYLSQTNNLMIKALENPNFPLSTSEQTFTLIYEDGAWRVVLHPVMHSKNSSGPLSTSL
jgi:hypothetical protein